MSLIQFDDQYEPNVTALPLAETMPLCTETFVPRGGTALLDAIGMAISETRERLKNTTLPPVVIVVILTDGEGNPSSRFTLAISLHAPNDDIRRQIIPWAKFVTIDELCEAGQHYFQTTGREVTLESILLRNVNDRPEHARELADVAKKLRSNINLIRYNQVAGLPYERPTTDDVRAFQAILQQHGLNTHIRQSRGRDIAAACGQLRHKTNAESRKSEVRTQK